MFRESGHTKLRHPLCVQCKERAGKVIFGERRGADGKMYEYVNANKRPLFCSVRCAANWALLWFNEEENESDLEDCGHI